MSGRPYALPVRMGEPGVEHAADRSSTTANRGHMPDLRSNEEIDFYFVHVGGPEKALQRIIQLVNERFILARFGLDPVDQDRYENPEPRTRPVNFDVICGGR